MKLALYLQTCHIPQTTEQFLSACNVMVVGCRVFVDNCNMWLPASIC